MVYKLVLMENKTKNGLIGTEAMEMWRWLVCLRMGVWRARPNLALRVEKYISFGNSFGYTMVYKLEKMENDVKSGWIGAEAVEISRPLVCLHMGVWRAKPNWHLQVGKVYISLFCPAVLSGTS